MDGNLHEDGVGNASSEDQPRKRPRLSAQLAREVGLMRSIPGDKQSDFVGSASGIYFIRSVYASLRRNQSANQFQGDTPGSEMVPGEDDHLTSIIPNASGHLWRADEVSNTTMKPVIFEDLVRWSGSYFANWHPFYPFLHAPTMLRYFEILSRDGLPQEGISFDFEMVILRSVMSISLADRRQSELYATQVSSGLVFHSYDAAVDSLQHVLSRPTSQLGLQAAISVQLFLVSMLRLNAASRLGGLINRMAVQLGLHRCPARYSTFVSNEKDMRRRILWSLYAIDRFICQSMGLPLGLNDDDIDVCFPNRERHVTGKDPQTSDGKLGLLTFVARQTKLRGEIIELRNKSLQHVQKNPDQAISITAQLAQWWNDIEERRDSTSSNRLTSYQSTVLTLLKHESIISLNRPVLAAAKKGANYDAALQLCIGSARSIITVLHKAIDGSYNADGNCTAMTLLWPSCTWAIWISTFVLFYAANSRHLSPEIVSRLADRSLEVLQHLAKRGSAWPEASAAAIRDLRARMTESEFNTQRAGQETLHNGQEHVLMPVTTRAKDDETGIPDNTRTTNTFWPGNGIHHSDYGLPREEEDHEQGFANALPLRSDHAEGSQNVNVSRQFDPSSERLSGSNAPNSDNLSNQNFNNASFEGVDMLYNLGPWQQNYNMQIYSGLDPFVGFDIPFWFDQDQHWDIFQDFNG